MNVRQLIERLQEFDPELPVVAGCYDFEHVYDVDVYGPNPAALEESEQTHEMPLYVGRPENADYGVDYAKWESCVALMVSTDIFMGRHMTRKDEEDMPLNLRIVE